METPFDKKPVKDPLTVRVRENYYRGDEIIAYFNDILEGLLNEEKSVHNRLQLQNMARILIKKRETNRAAGVIYQALARYPQDIDFLKLKTEIYIRAKDYSSAAEIINVALQVEPFDISVLMMKARICSLAGDDKEEEQTYLDMLRIPRNDYIIDKGKLVAMRNLADLYFKTRKYEEAEQYALKALRKAPDESVWALYFSILAKMNKGDELRKARDEFAKHKRARIYFDKGAEFEIQNKFNIALTNYKSGFDIFPNDPAICEKIGVIFLYRKKWYSRAEEFFKKAVELDPDHVSYRSNLVLCLKNQGKLKEAFEQAKIAESLDPMSNIHYLRNIALKLGKEKEDEFVETVKNVIASDPKGEYPSLRYEMGLLFEAKSWQQEAENWFKQALTLLIRKVNRFPDDWGTYIDLGMCCLKLEKYREAEGAFKTAETIPGADLEEVYENLVELYTASNQPNKATPYLQKLVKVQPASLVNYLGLGINYLTRLKSNLRKKDKDDE